MNVSILYACGDAAQLAAAGASVTGNRTPTPGTIIFEIVVLLGALAAGVVMARLRPRFPLHFLATAAGVLIFEVFTAPMWRNERLGAWGYLYHDVSWILTIGWTTLILGTMTLVDRLAPTWREGSRFALTLAMLLPMVVVAENVVVALGIRSYAPEVQTVLSGDRVGLVPIEVLFYVPVFTALTVAFARYWGFVIDDAALVPVRRQHWLRALGLTVLAVVLFEIMIEPIVQNRGLPVWSYFFRDISWLITGMWVALIAAVGLLVQRWLMFRPIPERFAAALALITAAALPVESWLIHHGYRAYGPSAVRNFTGYQTWLTGVPVEIVLAIPLYMALVIGFIRYWEIVGDNNL